MSNPTPEELVGLKDDDLINNLSAEVFRLRSLIYDFASTEQALNFGHPGAREQHTLAILALRKEAGWT